MYYICMYMYIRRCVYRYCTCVCAAWCTYIHRCVVCVLCESVSACVFLYVLWCVCMCMCACTVGAGCVVCCGV